METMGQRIKRLRQERGMTQPQLSAATGISIEHLSRIENDRHRPQPRTLRDLANGLGVSEKDLTGPG